MITPRQAEMLSEIIRQYSDSAEPVGSHALLQAFEVSSATIRSEMASLERDGYIYQPHISAGRVPTDKGYRYYVNHLVAGDARPRYELTMHKRVESLSDQVDRAIKIATETLSEMTGNTAFATLSDTVYFHGLHQLFSQPEFIDQMKASAAARYLDALSEWLFEQSPREDLAIFIGRENPFARTSGMAMVVARFNGPYSTKSAIGIVGPTRQNYSKVTTLVELTGKKLEEVLHV